MSFKVSPFFTLLVEEEKLILSAPSLFSANVKLIFVLVEFSKNILTIVLSFNRFTFLSEPSRISLNLNEVSIILFKSEVGKFSKPIRCLLFSINFSLIPGNLVHFN